MIATFCFVIAFYLAPLALFTVARGTVGLREWSQVIANFGVISPFMAMHHVPVQYQFVDQIEQDVGLASYNFVWSYIGASIIVIAIASITLGLVFRNRWALTGRG